MIYKLVKSKVIFVGSFVDKSSSGHTGGQLFACNSLLNSKLSKYINWIPIDTTAANNIHVPFYLRLLNATYRFLKFIFYLIIKRPIGVIIFSSSGFSFIEKGFMIILSYPFTKFRIFAPRSGYIKDQIDNNYFFEKYCKIVFNLSTGVICQGKTWKRYFENKKLVNSSKLIVINNWIKELPFAKNDNNTSETFNILFLGWMDRNKGVYDILELIRQLKYLNIKWILGGGGQELENLRKIKEEEGLDNLELTGWVHGDNKMKLFLEASLFLLPSYKEGMPNAVLEAMSFTLPIVSTNVGGIPDIVEHNNNGFLVEPGDIVGLKKYISLLFNNRNMLKEFGENSRKLVIQNHSLTNAENSFLSIMNF